MIVVLLHPDDKNVSWECFEAESQQFRIGGCGRMLALMEAITCNNQLLGVRPTCHKRIG
jgi:hypothetical protein